MDDDFEMDEDEVFETITPRKFDKQTLLALWFQHKARKKLVKGDWYMSLAQSILLHREYKVQEKEFQTQASREIEALVMAVEGRDGTAN